MSLTSPSFSHSFLNRLSIWSIDSLPLLLILITKLTTLLFFWAPMRQGGYYGPNPFSLPTLAKGSVAKSYAYLN